MTTDEWAAQAFRMITWRLTFMPDGEEKKKVVQFLIDAPDSVKVDASKLSTIPGII